MITEGYMATARLIPGKIRRKYVLHDGDPIRNAIPSGNDPYMKDLARVWYDFIDKNAERNFHCGLCMKGILDNYRQLKDSLEELERLDKILNAL